MNVYVSHDLPKGAIQNIPAMPEHVWPGPPVFENEVVDRSAGTFSFERSHLELMIPVSQLVQLWSSGSIERSGELMSVRSAALRPGKPNAAHPEFGPWVLSLEDRGQALLLLSSIRRVFLQRFPNAQHGLTIGDVQKLVAVMQAVVAYPLVKGIETLETRGIHPVFTAIAHVADRLWHMVGETPADVSGVVDTRLDIACDIETLLQSLTHTFDENSTDADRAFSGFMAGCFRLLLTGGSAHHQTTTLDQDVAVALSDLDRAFDYGLLAIQAQLALSVIWLRVAEAYEQIFEIALEASAAGLKSFQPVAERFAERMTLLRSRSRLASKKWRGVQRNFNQVLFDQCSAGLRHGRPVPGLSECQEAAFIPVPQKSSARLQRLLQEKYQSSAKSKLLILRLAACLTECATAIQAALSVAVDCQDEINRLLKRPLAVHPFRYEDIQVQNLSHRVQDAALPLLSEDLRQELGVNLLIEPGHIKFQDAMASRLVRS